MSDQPLLEQLQDRVVDRQPIDWDSLTSVEGSAGLTAQYLDALALLQLLDEIGHAHSTFQQQELTEPAVLDEELLESWGRYRLEERVGRGGFGDVYRAWDPVLEMTVAIKILHRHVGDEALTERLVREGRALAQVRHQNVVRVMNVEQHDGRTGLVMEFLRGDTIDGIVTAHGPMNDREATLIVEDVCRALAAVHTVPLIHRDVKARNVIRERAGRVVLMDFGAGLPEGENGPTVGTPLYMAPELLLSPRTPATVASDVYSVGVLLFFLVTGRHPVEGATLDQVREVHGQKRQQSLLALRPDLPLPFVKVVERALAPTPDTRYRSAAALLQALSAARDAGSNWRRRVVLGVAAFSGFIVLMTLGGMLSSASFNLTLGRSAYANESFAEWFVLGRRSMMLPIVLSLLAIGLVGLVLAARNVAISTWAAAKAMDRAVLSRGAATARRLLLHEPAICSCWLLLTTAAAAVATWLHWMPLLQAVTSDIAVAPAAILGVMSSPRLEYQTNYRIALSLLVAVNIAAAYALVRAAAWRSVTLPRWFIGAEIATLVLLFGSMQIPYRILNDTDEFSVVTWGTERCHLLGEQEEKILLFCPGTMPRQHVVAREAIGPERARGGGLFDAFAANVLP